MIMTSSLHVLATLENLTAHLSTLTYEVAEGCSPEWVKNRLERFIAETREVIELLPNEK
jgi:hypothetical protein